MVLVDRSRKVFQFLIVCCMQTAMISNVKSDKAKARAEQAKLYAEAVAEAPDPSSDKAMYVERVCCLFSGSLASVTRAGCDPVRESLVFQTLDSLDSWHSQPKVFCRSTQMAPKVHYVLTKISRAQFLWRTMLRHAAAVLRLGPPLRPGVRCWWLWE